MSTSRRLVNLPLVLALESLFQIPRPYLHVFEIQKGEVADLENNKDFLKVDNDGGGGCSGGGEEGGGGGTNAPSKTARKNALSATQKLLSVVVRASVIALVRFCIGLSILQAYE